MPRRFIWSVQGEGRIYEEVGKYQDLPVKQEN
jgi:hypothetical protein